MANSLVQRTGEVQYYIVKKGVRDQLFPKSLVVHVTRIILTNVPHLNELISNIFISAHYASYYCKFGNFRDNFIFAKTLKDMFVTLKNRNYM